MKSSFQGVAVVAALFCAASASSVFASTQMASVTSATDTDASQIKVYLRDVDMNRTDAMPVIYSRLNSASKMVCDSHAGLDLTVAKVDRACAQASLARAIQDLGMPALNDYALSVNPKALAHLQNAASAQSPALAAK